MKLVDANLFVFAYNPSAPEHERAARWLEDAFWDDEPVATSWTTLLAFVRLTTSAKIFARPYTPKEATVLVDAWLTDAGLTIVEPTERHWSVLRELIDETGARGNLVSDVHLAALALEYGATLFTDDADFRRFKGLKVEMPLRKP
ncbi:MAG: type II toxin-antitoxin system VapC family toxin [Myxococcaceae bacterium]